MSEKDLNQVELENNDTVASEPDALVEAKKAEKEPKAKEAKKDKAKNKKKKEKKPNAIAKKVRETSSELKKVTWPSFKTVLKKTGVVLAVVVIFTVVLFAIDRLLSIPFDWIRETITNK